MEREDSEEVWGWMISLGNGEKERDGLGVVGQIEERGVVQVVGKNGGVNGDAIFGDFEMCVREVSKEGDNLGLFLDILGS